MGVEFSTSAKERIGDLFKRYPNRRAALIPILYVAQEEFGHVSPEVMEHVAEVVGVPPADVYDVVTFYTMFYTKPMGKYHIQVCINISCSLMGAEHVVEHIKRKLGIEVGGTTPDGRFSLSTVECLGSCGTAPMMQINDDYHENLTEERIDKILGRLSKS